MGIPEEVRMNEYEFERLIIEKALDTNFNYYIALDANSGDSFVFINDKTKSINYVLYSDCGERVFFKIVQDAMFIYKDVPDIRTVHLFGIGGWSKFILEYQNKVKG